MASPGCVVTRFSLENNIFQRKILSQKGCMLPLEYFLKDRMSQNITMVSQRFGLSLVTICEINLNPRLS